MTFSLVCFGTKGVSPLIILYWVGLKNNLVPSSSSASIVFVLSDKRFIIVTNALISLLFGFLIYLFSGNWSMLYVSVVVSFFLTKYWVMSNWGSEMDEKKRELKIELMVFEESKKANLSNKKDL